MKQTGKVAVIGDKDSVLAFKALGMGVYATDNPFEAKDLIKRLSASYAVIFITERIASQIEDVIIKYKSIAYPILIPIPDGRGSTGFGLKGINYDVERAIGANILLK